MKLTTLSIRLLVATVLMGLTVVFVQACDSHSDQSQTENAMAKTGDSVEAEETTAGFREERDEVVADLEQEQEELDQEIDQLKDRINHQSNKTSKTLKRQLAELEKEHRDLAKDIDIAKNATEDVWQEIKAGFKKAGRTLGDSFENAGDQLNNR
ncbi:sll1863 family stress response protein [Spirosoma migulaei]